MSLPQAPASNPAAASFVPLAASLRGDDQCLETLHTGSIAVVEPDGRIVARLGDPEQRFPLRSTIKSIQLLPLLLDGLDTEFALSEADLAVMMSSHSGEEMHLQRIARLLQRFDLKPALLRCGSHPPQLDQDRLKLLQNGREPSVLHCNCSGKHTGMLAVCVHNGWPVETYLEPDHPLQIRILNLIRLFAEIPQAQRLQWYVDGCSLPTYALSLLELARVFARLANPDAGMQIEQQAAAPLIAKLRRAAWQHPEMIAGSQRLDTRLMRRYGGKLFSKSGADGMYAMALTATPDHPRGLGVAFKIADGDPDNRFRELVATSLLGWLEPGEFAGINDFMDTRRLNNAGTKVGIVQPIYQLKR